MALPTHIQRFVAFSLVGLLLKCEGFVVRVLLPMMSFFQILLMIFWFGTTKLSTVSGRGLLCLSMVGLLHNAVDMGVVYFSDVLPILSFRSPLFSPDVWNTRLLPNSSPAKWAFSLPSYCATFWFWILGIRVCIFFIVVPSDAVHLLSVLLAPTHFRRGWSVVSVRLFSNFGFGIVSFVKYCFSLQKWVVPSDLPVIDGRKLQSTP